jgi:hypothetical protein
MMKARTKTKDGRPLILLGLSRLNTERLHKGLPIKIDLQDPAPKGLEMPGGAVIFIMAGETEGAIAEELTALGIEFPS